MWPTPVVWGLGKSGTLYSLYNQELFFLKKNNISIIKWMNRVCKENKSIFPCLSTEEEPPSR